MDPITCRLRQRRTVSWKMNEIVEVQNTLLPLRTSTHPTVDSRYSLTRYDETDNGTKGKKSMRNNHYFMWDGVKIQRLKKINIKVLFFRILLLLFWQTLNAVHTHRLRINKHEAGKWKASKIVETSKINIRIWNLSKFLNIFLNNFKRSTILYTLGILFISYWDTLTKLLLPSVVYELSAIAQHLRS